MALLRRPARISGDQPVGAPTDPGMTQVYPVIQAYLCDDTWEDGSTRERSTMLIVAEGPMWKACMIDKETDATLWAAARTFDDLLACLESRLADPEAEWRKRRPVQAPKKRS